MAHGQQRNRTVRFLQRGRRDSGANITEIQMYSYETYNLDHTDCSLTLN